MILKNRETILYLAFGVEKLYNQVLFSILTLEYHVKNGNQKFNIVVYTDKPEYFDKYKGLLSLETIFLSKEMLIKFKGKHDFIHRIKICVIKDCLERCKGKVLYLDGDTFFIKNPLTLIQQISEEACIMFEDEYGMLKRDMEDYTFFSLRRSLEEEFVLSKRLVKIPFSTRMWNAGVIGIDYSNLPLLEDVFEVTDQICERSPAFTAEQMAFSYILQENSVLLPASPYVIHYWKNKNIIDYHLDIFFKRNKRVPHDIVVSNAYGLSLKYEILAFPLVKKNIKQNSFIS